jgi:apolipoprotein N-acyltransferase
MDRRYKKRARIGVAAWVLSPLAVLLLVFLFWLIFEPERVNGALMGGIMVVTFLVAFYFTFFWGGSQLAKAKGYSNAILVPGILGPPVQLVILALLLFALPDKCPDAPRPLRCCLWFVE